MKHGIGNGFLISFLLHYFIEVIILSETDNLFKAYSVQEIASMLGIGKTKTRELLDSGILPVTKVGRQYFTSPASIQEFLKKNIGKQIFF